MQALFTGEADSTAVLSSKLAAVAADLKTNDGKILVNQDEDEEFELSLADVLSGAASAAEKAADAIAADDSITGAEDIIDSLEQEEVNLVNEQAYQEANVGEDGLAETGVETPTEGDAIDKAKAMVEDIRLFSHLFDLNSTEGAGIQTQGEEYVELLDNASIMLEQEAENFTLLAKVSEVVAGLAIEFEEEVLTNETTSGGVAIPDGVLSEAGSGLITFNQNTATGGVLFTVNATDAGEVVALNISAEFADEGNSVLLTLDGLLESAGAKLTLSEGSFAKLSLDKVASREAFESGEYDGEITSGELDLTLTLAQKATDTVTNPVIFSGVLQTKLLAVGERTFDDDLYRQGLLIAKPRIQKIALPETLSLSGDFSSTEGDLVKATLTVNTNKLAEHEAPEFKYIGKEIENVLAVTISEDLNTFTLADSDNVEGGTAGTRVFIAGEEAGDWDLSTTIVPNTPGELDWTGNLESKFISRSFDTELDKKGLVFSSATVVGREEADDYFVAARLEVTPVDYDSNGTTDGYSFIRFSIDDGQDYDGTSISTLLDAEGNILLSNGEVATQENGWYMGDFTTIEQFIEENSWAMPVNPFEVENGTEFLVGLLTYQWKDGIAFNIDNEGIATVYFDEDEIEAIAAGEVTALNMSGYLTKALLKDAVTIEVSEDGNSIKRFFYDELVGSRTFNYTGDTIIPGNFETNATVNGEWDIRSVDTTSETTPIGLDVDEVLITTTYTYKYDYSDIRRVRVTPVDKNEDGIADTFQVYQIKASYVDDDGVLRDDEGNEVSFLDFYTYEFTSYDGDLGWALDFNPFEIDSALTLVKAVSPTGEYRAYEYVEGVGEISFSAPEKDMEVNTITSFDAYVEESDDTLLEDADNYIDVNAALTLEAILGEYDVKAQLSGKRTGLDDGKFDLELTYSLPGEDAQRSFTVQANTEQEGKLIAKNTEGVVLVLEEPAEDTEGTQVIGKILVGPTAIQAATIEDRGGLIVIVYSAEDEVTEIETL